MYIIALEEEQKAVMNQKSKEKGGKDKNNKSIDSNANSSSTPSSSSPSSSGMTISSVVNPPAPPVTPINWTGEEVIDPKTVPLLLHMRQKAEEKLAERM